MTNFVNKNSDNDQIRAAIEAEGHVVSPNLDRAQLMHKAEEIGIWTQVLASVVPDSYKERYGADQNCGDEIALILKGEDINAVGTANGIDVEKKWGLGRVVDGLPKPLNPGMQRMNLGNVLRGRVQRGEYVVIGEHEFNPENKADVKKTA